ncbi:MAG TPA: GTPase [Actinomycetota bacterium]|jgi:50S ribosome-binding GTPase
MPVIDTAAVQGALGELGALVEAATFQVPVPGDGGGEDRRRLAWHLREYLLPRVRDLEAPLVAVLIGSTGAGKSSLLNGLARRRVSPSGVIRPTTVRPLALLAPGQVDAFMGGRVLKALADDDRLRLAVDERAFPGVVLVDAPDLDSVETANQLAADELLQAADLCLFVTTAQRYADAVPWQFLRRARERGVPLMVVVNRLPRDEADRAAVMADCRRLFAEAGLEGAGPRGALPFLGVVEGARDDAVDGLDAAAIEPLRRALDELAADPLALGAVKAAALRGAVAGLPGAVERLAGDLERDRQRAARLRAPVERAYAGEAAKLAERLGGGEFLRGEVMRSWQEFVGVGDVGRWLSSGVGRVRSWLARRLRPRSAEAPIEQAKERAFEQLVAALVRHADAAAAEAATAWAADPGGAGLMEAHPELWGHGERLQDEAHGLLTAWLGRLAKVVEERGQNRRAFAFVTSLGVNAIGVVAMLAVFAHSAGLTGGELAIAGGTAVLNQKLLEALIGEAAVTDIIRGADRDLRATLRAGLESDRARFLDLLAPGEAGPEELRAAAGRVATEAERLLAGLDAAGDGGSRPAKG